MKTRKFALCLAAVFLVMIYINIQRNHTFTLSDDEGTIKTEQIQPLWGTVKVSGDCDTDVVFTDVETGEKYKIGYFVFFSSLNIGKDLSLIHISEPTRRS